MKQGRTDKLLALEELLEGEIEKRSGAETVGLIFVERRITAMALHNYFRWRSEEADKTKLARAKTLRHAVADPFPQVQLCKDGEESQYDDSAGKFKMSVARQWFFNL